MKTTRPSEMKELSTRQRLIARNALEQEALREGYLTLQAQGPQAAVAVLETYAPALDRLDALPAVP